MHDGKPHEADFQIAKVEMCDKGEHAEPLERNWKMDVLGGPGGALGDPRSGTEPDAAQLAEEGSSGHRAPARQGGERPLELVRALELLAERRHTSAVPFVDRLGEPLEPARGTLGVARVAAPFEKLAEIVPLQGAGSGDGFEAGSGKYPERAQGDSWRRPPAEQGRSQGPALHLMRAPVGVDAEFE